MNKKTFDKELRTATKHLPEDERQKLLDYYSELYNEKYEQGFREEEIIKNFGTPESIVAELEGESIFDKGVKKVKATQKKAGGWLKRTFTNKTFLLIYFSAFIITIPLTIMVLGLGVMAIAMIAALTIGAIALIFGLFFGFGFGLTLGGPLVSIAGIVTIAYGHTNIGLAQIGAGLTLFAVGILLLKFIRVLRYLRILIFVKRSKRAAKFERMKPGRKLRIIGFIVCGVSLLVGAAIFTLGFGLSGWDIGILDWDAEFFKEYWNLTK